VAGIRIRWHIAGAGTVLGAVGAGRTGNASRDRGGTSVDSQAVLGGRYRIRSVLGDGGMSVVLLATDLRLHRDVAVKVLRTALRADPEAVARFHREADNACALDHPGIVGVYDTGGDTDGAGREQVPYLVVEHVDGETLAAILDRDGALPVPRALEIAAEVLEALHFAHRHGIVHGSLSPAAIMLDRGGTAKMMDFGADFGPDGGAWVGSGRSAVPGADGTTAPRPALLCASPEQVARGPIDARSDVFSVGCVLWQMLTGRPLFGAAPAEPVAAQPSSRTGRSARTLPAALPADVLAVIRTATRRRPLDRYQTAAQMRTVVRAALARQLLPAIGPESGDVAAPIGGFADPSRPDALAPPLLRPPDLTAPTPPGDTGTGADATGDTGPRPRAWSRWVLAAVCAVLLAGAAMITGAVLTAAPPPPLVAVPDLSGRTLDQATALLRDHGLTLGTVGRIESSDAARNKVVDQRPSQRTQVDPNTPVSVEIGRGVTVVSVPDLKGATGSQARARLAAVKLVYAEKLAASSDPDKGRVIAQDASARSSLRPGSTVTVTIGTGLNLVTVPDGVIGSTADAARGVLRAAGLTMVVREGDGAAPVNEVIALDQPVGRQVPQGTPITVTVSNNTLMVMPTLGGTPQDAVTTLRSAGWAGDLAALAVSAQPTANPAAVGTVVAQDPAPGTLARKIGTPVRLAVGVRQVQMPSLVGRTQQQAARTLARAGATAVTFADAGAGPRGRAGRVAAQSVPAGTPIAADAPIVVSIFTR
jgi:serine/threonine-protein kinase